MSQRRMRLARSTSSAARWVRHHQRQAVVALGVLGVSLAALALAGRSYLLAGLPDDAALQRLGAMDQATVIYDSHDQLAFTIFREQRIEVPLNKVSLDLIRAVIAIEDQRFYDHRGFDLVRIAAAALADVRRTLGDLKSEQVRLRRRLEEMEERLGERSRGTTP